MAVIAGLSEVRWRPPPPLGRSAQAAGVLMVAVMITAAGGVHWSNGFFAMVNGIEVPTLHARRRSVWR